MSKRNPLRRLSVALRLTEAYQPSMPVSPSDEPSLSKFLTRQKNNWLQDVKEDPVKAAENWTVVMGNEAGDLDSLASSIAYAWILTEWKKTPSIPLIQVDRADLALRSENLYALKLAGVSESELLTLTEITELGLKPFPGHKFALVDHNRIGSAFTLDNPKADVIAVVDHHEDEKLYPNAQPRVIGKAGSCASHVATLLPPDPLPEVATLLLTAILIDTDGLKPGGKAEQVDRDSSLIVATKSTLSNSIPPLSALAPIDSPNPDALYETQAIKDLTATLSEKKSDVAHLSGFDLLRRDYKEYTHPLTWAPGTPSIKVGLSTVPSPLQAWGAKGQLEKDAVKWMSQRGLTALGVLTSFRETKSAAGKIADAAKKASGSGKVDKGKHKREQAWILLNEPELSHLATPIATSEAASTSPAVLTIDVLAERFFSGLESAKALELERHKKFGDVEKSKDLPPKSKARVYKQGIADATRKVTAPIVKAVLEGGEMPVFGGEMNEEEELIGKKKEKGKDKEKKKDKEGKKDKKKKDEDGEEKEKDEDDGDSKKKNKGKDKDKKKDKEGKKDKKDNEDAEKEKDKKKDKGKDKKNKKSTEIEAEISNVAEVEPAKN